MRYVPPRHEPGAASPMLAADVIVMAGEPITSLAIGPAA